MYSALRTPHSAFPRRGFTLVEMLVVITIIAILASLGTYAAFNALNMAKDSRIKVEIGAIDMALKTYKQNVGSYPPSDMSDIAAIRRHMLQRWPQASHTNTELAQVARGRSDTTTTVMSPAQALVFWLGPHNPNPARPFDYTATPAGGLFDFDKGRLLGDMFTPGSRTSSQPLNVYYSGTDTLAHDENGNNVFNPPVYIPAGGEGTPYVYFNARSYDNLQFNTANANDIKFASTTPPPRFAPGPAEKGTARPYAMRLKSGAMEMINKDTFQLISAGQDGEYGDAAIMDVLIFPDGQHYTRGDGDNIVNFSEKNLEDAKP